MAAPMTFFHSDFLTISLSPSALSTLQVAGKADGSFGCGSATVIADHTVGNPMSVGSAVAITIERIVTPVERMHRAISQRWFAAVGPLGRPVAPAHNAVAKTVYTSVRIGALLAGTGVDRFMSVRPAIADRTQAVINGLWGDALGHHAARLEVPMGMRDRSSKPVAFERIGEAYPAAQPHLVFLLHGFADTERCWLSTDGQPGLHDALAATGAVTPILIRYNTGRSLSDNAELLAALIEECVSAWPVPVETVAAVGHSMGGLVIRSACAAGQSAGHGWVARVSNAVTIASPHLGTPIEKAVHSLAAGLGIARETVPLQEFVDTRSDGIKDLRVGLAGYSLHPGIAHHFVAGVVTKAAEHPVGAAVGDLVVRVPSASGGTDAQPASTLVVGGVRHNDLVHNDEVINRVVSWLDPGAAALLSPIGPGWEE